MPSKKKKYNARFPAGRIKKIMQSDEEIGKVAQAVPVIISRTLELFVESLLTKTLKITNSRNAKTLSTSHMKQCIMSEQRFDFLRELVKNIPDISVAEDEAAQSSPEEQYPDSDTPYDLSMPSTSTQAASQRSVISTSSNGGSSSGGVSGGVGTNLCGVGGASDIVNYKRLANNMSMGNSTSVIMHTTSVVNAITVNDNESLPPKLARSDSSPAQVSATPVLAPIWRPVETSLTAPRKRLKQQSQSLPISNNNNNNNNNSNTNNNNNNNNNSNNNNSNSNSNHSNSDTPLKQQSLPQMDSPLFHSQPAISPPIVNFDFCTKPVVKIDYSNLSLTAKTSTTTATISTAPLSAPVLSYNTSNNITTSKNKNNNNNNNNNSNKNNNKDSVADTAFDFSSAAPIINIDLTNMMTTRTNSEEVPLINGPAVATISIGALPIAPAITKPATPPNTTQTPNAIATTKSNALFELDEDYDNI